nr:hypothetical protein [Tanacetum cinerariifolium]
MSCEALSKEISTSILCLLIPLVSKDDTTMMASCKTCWSFSSLRHCVCMRCAVTFKCLTIDARIHTAKTFDLVWIWLGGDYGNVFINGFSWDSVLNMCRNYLHGSLSEQRTHEFMYIYLATASVPAAIFFPLLHTSKNRMARLQFYDYHNMVAILEKGEFNTDFHPMVDFIAASPLRYALTVKPTIFVSHIRQFWSTARIDTTDEGTYILATVDGIQRTISESSLKCNLKLRDEDGIISILDTKLFENLTLMGQYSRRGRISQSSALPTLADEPASPVRDVSKREAYPTESGFIADQDRATIAKSSTLPHDSAPKVISPATDEGSMQHTAQEVEILRLKERVQVLEDREVVAAKQSGDDAPIKGMSINEREAAAERISNDSEDTERVLTSMDAATVLAGGIDVPTSSGSIPTAGPPATDISTDSKVGPTASPIVTSYSRRKGKEVMVESDTP